MSKDNRSNSIVRAISESKESTEYSTPYLLACSQLRPQNAKVRATVVELLRREFDLHEFDAETVARAAADLSQLKEAIRSVRYRRYGRLEIKFLEYDVVTWRILPSLENIRFEGDRALQSKALRYESLSESPVLTLRHESKDHVLAGLREQTNQIWRTNPHAKSIPLRGIEVPGLLAISRLSIGDSPVVGLLDATDGFSRTVGALRGSGVDVSEVIFDLSDDLADMRFRNELIALRDSGVGDVDSTDGEVAGARLRTSVMPRAQVIVGYRWLDEPGAPAVTQGFDHARRSLVGHIHLEPAMKFTDSTQFALKAKIALEAVHAAGDLPRVPGYTDDELLEVLMHGAVDREHVESEDDLLPDEVALVAIEAIRGMNGSDRVKVVNRAISSLTGKAPSRTDRGILAVDTAMRAKLIASGVGAVDPAYIGKRSTLGRAWTAKALSSARLTRRPVVDLLEEAVEHVQSHRLLAGEDKVSPAAAELGALALFDLVDNTGLPLIVRSGTKNEKDEYLPEPPAIIDRLMKTEGGLNQLAQAILDVRAGRRPRKLDQGQAATPELLEDNAFLSRADVFSLATGKSWQEDMKGTTDPVKVLDQSVSRLGDQIDELAGLVKFIEGIVGPDDSPMIAIDGAPFSDQWVTLSDLSFTLRGWARTYEARVDAARAAHEADIPADDFETSGADGQGEWTNESLEDIA